MLQFKWHYNSLAMLNMKSLSMFTMTTDQEQWNMHDNNYNILQYFTPVNPLCHKTLFHGDLVSYVFLEMFPIRKFGNTVCHCISTCTVRGAYAHCAHLYWNIKMIRIMNDTTFYVCFGLGIWSKYYFNDLRSRSHSRSP